MPDNGTTPDGDEIVDMSLGIALQNKVVAFAIAIEAHVDSEIEDADVTMTNLLDDIDDDVQGLYSIYFKDGDAESIAEAALDIAVDLIRIVHRTGALDGIYEVLNELIDEDEDE